MFLNENMVLCRIVANALGKNPPGFARAQQTWLGKTVCGRVRTITVSKRLSLYENQQRMNSEAFINHYSTHF